MGLKGPELMNFAREQQTLSRERRERQREKEKLDREKEDERLQLMRRHEIEQKAKEDERLKKLRLFEVEQKTKENERKAKEDERLEKMRLLEMERAREKEKERLFEAEKVKWELKREEKARQEKEKERQLELERKEEARQEKEKKRQFELDQKERKLQLEQEHAKICAEKEYEKHEQEIEKLDLKTRLRKQEARATEGRGRQSDGNGEEVPIGKAVGKVSMMPYFDEERDFMDSYLGRFERFAETQKWKREHWAMYLSALLKGRALDVYSRMPPKQASDFERLKDALLKRYQLSADGFKKRFCSAKPEAGETASQFLTRIDNYQKCWIELAKATKSYAGLKTLIVQEQYLSTCPKEMAMHLKEGKQKTITELEDVAENYVEAHATDIVFGLDPRLPKFRSAQSTTQRCYRCGKTGHISSQCSRRASDDRPAPPSKTPGTPYAQPRAGYSQPQTPRSPSQFQRSSYPWSPPRGSAPRCFLSNRPGHFARNCLIKPTAAVELQSQGEEVKESQEEVAAC